MNAAAVNTVASDEMVETLATLLCDRHNGFRWERVRDVAAALLGRHRPIADCPPYTLLAEGDFWRMAYAPMGMWSLAGAEPEPAVIFHGEPVGNMVFTVSQLETMIKAARNYVDGQGKDA